MSIEAVPTSPLYEARVILENIVKAQRDNLYLSWLVTSSREVVYEIRKEEGYLPKPEQRRVLFEELVKRAADEIKRLGIQADIKLITDGAVEVVSITLLDKPTNDAVLSE